MKLRLTASGFESYSGQMGVITFENGLSVGDVLPVDAVRVAGVIGAEWEDGTPANVGQMYLDNIHTHAPTDEEQRAAAKADTTKTVGADVAKARAEQLGVTYTEEQLANIADSSGIAGLREIAEPLGIKGNSIRGLISGIMKAAGSTAKAE